MKNTIKTILFVLVAIGLSACDPQDNDNNKLGELGTISNEEVSYTKVVSEKSDNVIEFTNTSESKVPHAMLWDLGNGVTSKSQSVVGEYPFAGEYTVTLSLYTADGNIATKTEVIKIEKNDYSLLETKTYMTLTGGIANVEGRVWMLDQYNNFSKEVAEKTGHKVNGHYGLGPSREYSQEWWAAGANDKADWSLYSHKFKFSLEGLKMKISNAEGKGYGRKASATSVGGFTVLEDFGDDVSFKYEGGDFTFSVKEGAKPILTLSKNAFLSYYCGTQDYEIFYQTDEVFAVRVANSKEGHDWVLVFCREELNVKR